MTNVNTDRNLLFGILALQMDFISKEALVKAMNGWVLEKAKGLGQILVEQKALSNERRVLLETLVQEHLKQHGDDGEKSLAAVPAASSLREDLKQITDPDLHASLIRVSAARMDETNTWATSAPSVGASTSSGQRFRILRPHARGGLGQVSVAHDEELKREVALKEIQTPFADDPNSRSRFVQEAEITGGLEHPGIVPVYGLGSYADGRPYYAMRFIRGDSLKDAIDRFHKAEEQKRDPGARTLELRQLLRRFLDVCNAIAYAHSRGVLHRDLKPGNIMLGQYGETLVVDWGLAKPIGQAEAATTREGPLMTSSASGSAPTQMGSAVGTPQFMSPEQAAGRLDLLGPASDVYSLGATLYCLLTGQPAVTDDDLGVLLQKVQRGEFPRPRQMKADVPAALEAICLKAMALKPEDRYASPQALADDVEHWLADEPASAFREPWTARAARWARRHRTGVTAAGVLFLAGVLGLVLGLWAVSLEQARTARERDQATENLVRAVEAEKEAKANLALAEANYQRALQAVDQMLSQVGQERLAHLPQVEPIRRALLHDALTFYREFLKEKSADPKVRWEASRAYLRVADIERLLGRYAEAEEACGEAIGLLAGLLEEEPDKESYLQALAESYNRRGTIRSVSPFSRETEEDYRKALAVYEKLATDFPQTLANRFYLARAFANLALARHRLGYYQEASEFGSKSLRLKEEVCAQSPANREYRASLALSHRNMGHHYWDRGQVRAAEESYRQSLTILEPLADRTGHPDDRLYMSRSYADLGKILAQTGRQGEAEDLYRKAIGVAEKLAADYPAAPVYLERLGYTTRSLAYLVRDRGRQADARILYARTLEVFRKLAETYPGHPVYQRDLAQALADSGDIKAGILVGSRACLARENDVSGVQSTPAALSELAQTCYMTGKMLQRSRQYHYAELYFMRGLAARRARVDVLSILPTRSALANQYSALGMLYEEMDRGEKAEFQFRQAATVFGQLASEFPLVQECRAEQARNQRNLSRMLEKRGEWKEAEASMRQALALYEKLDAESPEVPYHRTSRVNAHYQIGILAEQAGRGEDAAAALGRAIELTPENGGLWLARHLVRARLGQWADADADYRKAADCSAAFRPKLDQVWLQETLSLAPSSRGHWRSVLADWPPPTSEKSDWWLWRARGLAHTALGEWREAVASFSRSVQARPEDRDSWRGRGRANLGLRMTREGIDDFSRAVALKDDDWADWFFRGVGNRLAGQDNEAVRDLTRAIESGASGWGVWDSRARAHYSRRAYAETIADYSRVLEVHRSAMHFYNRGLAYREKGDLDKAIADFSEALTLSPRYLSAYTARCWAYHLKGDSDKAIRDATDAIRIDPKSVLAYYNRGVAYASKGDHEKAVKDYSAALAIQSNYSAAYSRRADARIQLNNVDGALRDLDELIKLQPKNARAYRERGRVYSIKGDPTKAAENYAEALRLDPADTYARNLLTILFRGKGGPQAEKVFRETLAQAEKRATDFPNVRSNQANLAWTCQQFAYTLALTGRPAEAEKLFRRSLELWQKLTAESTQKPESRQGLAQVLNMFGSFLFATGQVKEAETHYRQALALREKLTEEFPREADYRADWALTLTHLADLLHATGRQADAGKSYRQAAAAWEKLTAEAPKRTRYSHERAWFLAICPEPGLRNVKLAVELARKAVKEAPETAQYRKTLGVALYRAGDWKASVAELEEGARLYGEPYPIDQFFLAMNYHRLGDREKARKWYDQGVEWSKERKYHPAQNQRFQAEAAETLGLKGDETKKP